MVNAGFRWDGQWNPQPPNPNPAVAQTQRIPNDLAMWQPRLGLSWDPKGHGTTVIRASAGLYDARTPANLFQRMFTDNGLTTAVLDSKFDKTVLNFVQFPNTLSTIPAGVKPAPAKVGRFLTRVSRIRVPSRPAPAWKPPSAMHGRYRADTPATQPGACSAGWTKTSSRQRLTQQACRFSRPCVHSSPSGRYQSMNQKRTPGMTASTSPSTGA